MPTRNHSCVRRAPLLPCRGRTAVNTARILRGDRESCRSQRGPPRRRGRHTPDRGLPSTGSRGACRNSSRRTTLKGPERWLVRKVAKNAALTCVFLKGRTQRSPTAMQSRHHCADRRPHNVGDLLVREALDVCQVDRDTEVFGKSLERFFHV